MKGSGGTGSYFHEDDLVRVLPDNVYFSEAAAPVPAQDPATVAFQIRCRRRLPRRSFRYPSVSYPWVTLQNRQPPPLHDQ